MQCSLNEHRTNTANSGKPDFEGGEVKDFRGTPATSIYVKHPLTILSNSNPVIATYVKQTLTFLYL